MSHPSTGNTFRKHRFGRLFSVCLSFVTSWQRCIRPWHRDKAASSATT